jgi:heat shock protein HslJ
MTVFEVAAVVWLVAPAGAPGSGTVSTPANGLGRVQTDGRASPGASQAVTTRAGETLAGTAWNAVELNGAAVPLDVGGQDRRPHLVFGTDGRLSGADGCNRLAGPYTLQAGAIMFGELVGTRMACPGADELARRFHEALNGVSRWRLVEDRLELSGTAGKPAIVFERRPPG